MIRDDLKFLADRLKGIDSQELIAAVDLLCRAEANAQVIERNSVAEHALFHQIWGCVTDALDHRSFAPQYQNHVSALEAELAGRVLTIRLALGWLVRSESGPTSFQRIDEFL